MMDKKRQEETGRIPRSGYRTRELIARTYFERRETIGCNFLFFSIFFMEHNRLAEEGYYLAIPSGRTKNFILSPRESRSPLSLFRQRVLVLSRFLAISPFSRPPPVPGKHSRTLLSRRPLPRVFFRFIPPRESYTELAAPASLWCAPAAI